MIEIKRALSKREEKKTHLNDSTKRSAPQQPKRIEWESKATWKFLHSPRLLLALHEKLNKLPSVKATASLHSVRRKRGCVGGIRSDSKNVRQVHPTRWYMINVEWNHYNQFHELWVARVRHCKVKRALNRTMTENLCKALVVWLRGYYWLAFRPRCRLVARVDEVSAVP